MSFIKKHPNLLLALILSLAVLFVTVAVEQGVGIRAAVFDGAGLTQGVQNAQGEVSGSGIRTDTDFIGAVAEIINFALGFAGVIALAAFIVSGFMFILGFGSDSSIQRAKKIMIWTAIGLIVIIFSYTIVNFIIAFAT